MAGLMNLFGGGSASDASDGSSNSSGLSSGAGGLMSLFTDPNKAALFNFFNGMLQASGPSRIPMNMGQVFAGGVQGGEQGFGNALNTQRQIMQYRALQGLMGGSGAQSAQPSQPVPQVSPSPPVTGGANTAGMSGLMAGLGSVAPSAGAAASAAAGAYPASAGAGGNLLFGRTPAQLFQQGMLMNAAGIQGGGDMMKLAAQYDPTLQAQMPTDITKMGVQGGMSPDQIQAANAAGVAKANYIAPLNARPGSILRNPLTMQPMAFNPNIPAGGTPFFDASGNVVGINSIPGAAGVTSQMAAAKAGGEGSVLPYSGVDASGNPLPVTNRTAAATQANGVVPATGGAAPLPGIANNNPGNLKDPSTGQFQQFPTQQAGIAAADANLLGYQTQHGINTVSGIVNRWAPKGDGNNDPAAYAAAVTKATGFGPNQKLDLTNPGVRNTLLNAMFDVETPGWRNAGATVASPAPGTGQIYAAPPLGATTAANASQGAPSKQMADAYGALSDADSNYQASRAALQTMIGIAQNQGTGDTVARLLPSELATKVSNDAAEYEKAHANFVSLQGKALGGGGTDASRATLDAAVPTFDKPQDAKIQGLTNQLQQLDMSHLKTQFLTPLYQQGNEKTYTTQSAAFDQNVKPSMMPVLQMSGAQQQAAVQASVKVNPALRPNFEWAFNNGLLK